MSGLLTVSFEVELRVEDILNNSLLIDHISNAPWKQPKGRRHAVELSYFIANITIIG